MAKKDNKLYLMVGILAVVAVIATALIAVNIKTQQVQVINPPQDQWDLTLPLNLIIKDKWEGDVMGTAESITKTIYDMNLNQKEQLTTTTVQTTAKYKPNEQYWVKFDMESSAGTVDWFKYYKITVPFAKSSSATVHDINFDFYTHGNYTIIMNDPDGANRATQVSLTKGINSEAYNVTAKANVYPTFTLQVVNNVTAVDTGIMVSEDPVYAVTREPTLIIHMYDVDANMTATASCLITTVPLVYSVSTTNKYYAQVLPVDYLVRDKKPDGSLNSAGIYTISLGIDAAGMTATTGTLIVVSLYSMDNLNYFKTYGTHPVGYETSMCLNYIFTLCAT